MTDILETLQKTSNIKRYILNYIATHKKKWKSIPTIYCSKHIKDTIILVFGTPRITIFTGLNSIKKEGVFSILYLCQQIKNGILVFTTENEVNKANHGILSKIIHEKYKISTMFFLNTCKISKHIKYKKGPVIGIIATETPRTEFLEKLDKFVKKIKTQVQYKIHLSQKNLSLCYNPYFLDVCFLSLPVCKNLIHKKCLKSLLKLIRYIARYM